MQQQLLDHIERSHTNKPAPVKRMTRSEIIMLKMFGPIQPKSNPEERPNGRGAINE